MKVDAYTIGNNIISIFNYYCVIFEEKVLGTDITEKRWRFIHFILIVKQRFSLFLQ